MNKKYTQAINITLILAFIGFAYALSWVGNDVNYYAVEDALYIHNFSANITDITSDTIFNVDTQNTNLTWNNTQIEYSSISDWMWFFNSTTGEFYINTTNDNQAGIFYVPIKATWSGGAITSYFNFTINATNDAPTFTLNDSYNTSVSTAENSSILININGQDEELHYPLILENITFNSCVNALWSTRNEDCNLNFTNSSNSNIVTINFTNLSRNDVGQYNISICLNDTVNQSNLPTYRNADYNQSKTTCKNTILNIEQALTIDISNCNNSILQENSSFNCQINVTTRRQSDNLIAWSNATIRSNNVNAINSSWFYSLNESGATDFMQAYNITLTPQKSEIGNWTINFTAIDLDTDENKTETIYLYVNRTINSNPEISIQELQSNTTSTNKNTTINITVYDKDFLIQDKTDGFNETINFTITFYNSTTRIPITNLDEIFSQTEITNTNRTEATIIFFAEDIHVGDYTLNITVSDKGLNGENLTDSQEYNFTILSRSFPTWNQTEYEFDLIVNTTQDTTQEFLLNLSNYVNDSDNSTMIFTNSTSFSSFNMTSIGIINFTPYKQDVGYHEIIITASNGYLETNTSLFFNITNTNSAPNITDFWGNNVTGSGETILEDSEINTSETNLTTFYLKINDDDLLINSIYYNETIQITTTTINITNENAELFEFTEWDCDELCNENQTGFVASFTPTKSQLGLYNVSIEIKDFNNETIQRNFTLNILATNNPPLLSDLTNQTSSVNRTLYYEINATDIEDGISEPEGNLTFSYTFLEGTDFFNSTTFNTKTGEINITFNETHSGKYKINVTVTDFGLNGEGNLTDSAMFWIYVYNTPNITTPSSEETFISAENSTYNFTFAINHSIGDYLNYSFYLNSEIINSSLGICNGTNQTLYFTPNFTQEGYGSYSNFSLIVFNPTYPDLNLTRTWNFNITHTNYPIENYKSMDNKSGASTITINLEDYFKDIDASDINLNQTITFNYTIINSTSGSLPTITINDWINGSSPTITFSSASSSTGIYSITAYEYNQSNNSQIIRNVTTANFSVELSIVTIVTTTPSSGGGGGGSTTINTIKLLAASEQIINTNGYMELSFEVINTGKSALNNINLTSIVQKEISEDIDVSLSKNNIEILNPGNSEKISLYINTNTRREGKYSLFLYANVSSPKIYDWAEISLNIIKSNESEAEKMIIFTEKLIIENPECLELNEVFKEAKKLFESGDYSKSIETSEKIVESCKNKISKNSQIRIKNPLENNYANYLLFIFITLLASLIYFVYKRARFKNNYPLNP